MQSLIRNLSSFLACGEERNTTVVADNRFWNVSKMELLRTMNIGGLGTLRINAKSVTSEVNSEINK